MQVEAKRTGETKQEWKGVRNFHKSRLQILPPRWDSTDLAVVGYLVEVDQVVEFQGNKSALVLLTAPGGRNNGRNRGLRGEHMHTQTQTHARSHARTHARTHARDSPQSAGHRQRDTAVGEQRLSEEVPVAAHDAPRTVEKLK